MPDNLSPMKDVHPSDGLGTVDLAEINLGSLQILVPQDNFRYDLWREHPSLYFHPFRSIPFPHNAPRLTELMKNGSNGTSWDQSPVF
jgi:hypothetical protein